MNNIINKYKNKFIEYLKSSRFKYSMLELFKILIILIFSYLVALIIILVISKGSLSAVKTFVLMPLTESFSLREVLKNSGPLMMTGVGASLIVRSGRFNMFTEGGFLTGALITSIVCVYLKLPIILTIPISFLISFIFNGAVGSVPAVLKEKLDVNEFVSSIMLNFIFLAIIVTLITYPLLDDTSGIISMKPTGILLPVIGGVNLGVFIGIICCIMVFILLYFSTLGYEIKMTGDNENYAKNLGINTSRATIISQILGTGLAGVGGSIFMLNKLDGRFSFTELTQHGFDGFMIAIIAKNNPILVPFVALFLSYLRQGGDLLRQDHNIPSQLVNVIQGLVIIFVAAKAFAELGLFKKLAYKIRSKQEEVL